MTNKPMLQAASGFTSETTKTFMEVPQQYQLEGQSYPVDEKITHTYNVDMENKDCANIVNNKGLGWLMYNIRKFVGEHLFSPLCKPIQLLRINSRADAIDEIKDIYHL